MATNLVTTIMQSLTPDMIAKIASLLGIDRSIAEKAIGAGIPAILASFANLASSPDGARQLSSTLAHQPANGLEQIRNAIGAGQQSAAEGGASLLSGLLGGSGLNALAGAIGSFAGTGANTGKSLLGMLGPVVAGVLGQQQRNNGLDANGLASLLASQKDQIAAAMPSGFTKMLSGTDVLGAFDGGMRRTADTVSAARGRMADMADDAVARTGQAAYAASRSASASSSWPYWGLAALVALVGIGWYFLTAHDTQQVAEQQDRNADIDERDHRRPNAECHRGRAHDGSDLIGRRRQGGAARHDESRGGARSPAAAPAGNGPPRPDQRSGGAASSGSKTEHRRLAAVDNHAAQPAVR